MQTSTNAMVCPPVRGDNLLALARGLSHIHVERIYNSGISVDLVHSDVSCVRKGDIQP